MRTPARKSELDLQRRAWIPNRAGQLCSARDLYWPGDDVLALVGDAPALIVHPEFVVRAPEARGWLPLRDTERAALEDVVAVLANSGRPASDAALRWLDEGLASKRLTEAGVFAALSAMPCFEDDLGVLRKPGELLVSAGSLPSAGRRGIWSDGIRFRHLAKALRISRKPEASDILALLAEVERELAAERVQEGTERLLPACLDLLVQRSAKGPKRIPVVIRQSGALRIVVLPDSALDVAVPGGDEPHDAELVLADGASPESWRQYMKRYGVAVDEVASEALAPAQAEDLPPPPLSDETDIQENNRETGVFSRLRTWFRSEDADDAEEKSPERAKAPRGEQTSRRNQDRGASMGSAALQNEEDQPFRPVDQRAWFGSASPLTPQLRSNASWLADRGQAPQYGLSHAPHSLPLPHRYAPNAIYGRFHRGRQSWTPAKVPHEYALGGRPTGRLHLRGKLPSPEARIPMPLFARFAGHQLPPEAKVVDANGIAVLLSQEDVRASLFIDLQESPNFSESIRAKDERELLEECVATSELPDEVLDLIESLRAEESALAICNTVRSFVRRRYVYDPTYLEDPQMAAWLRERCEGRSNLHIAALHAGGDVRHLGRGVCFELGSLVCEILRRCGVAAGVATGWTFDRGHIDEPDHLWAMALLQTAEGLRWFPVDASTTESGRPLHASHRPPGPWKADPKKARKLPEPAWYSEEQVHREAEAIPLGDLLRVARYLEGKSGRHLGTRGQLLAACRDALSDPERRDALITLLTGEAPSDEPR